MWLNRVLRGGGPYALLAGLPYFSRFVCAFVSFFLLPHAFNIQIYNGKRLVINIGRGGGARTKTTVWLITWAAYASPMWGICEAVYWKLLHVYSAFLVRAHNFWENYIFRIYRIARVCRHFAQFEICLIKNILWYFLVPFYALLHINISMLISVFLQNWKHTFRHFSLFLFCLVFFFSFSLLTSETRHRHYKHSAVHWRATHPLDFKPDEWYSETSKYDLTCDVGKFGVPADETGAERFMTAIAQIDSRKSCSVFHKQAKRFV